MCDYYLEISRRKSFLRQWKCLGNVIEIESQLDIAEKEGLEKRWVLDISYGDDQSRIRKGNTPRNIAII